MGIDEPRRKPHFAPDWALGYLHGFGQRFGFAGCLAARERERGKFEGHTG